jgi:hypothetical protein
MWLKGEEPSVMEGMPWHELVFLEGYLLASGTFVSEYFRIIPQLNTMLFKLI